MAGMDSLREELLPEWRRSVAATVLAIAGSAVGTAITHRFAEVTPLTRTWLASLLAWAMLALIHAGMTWWVFRRRTGSSLELAVAAATPRTVGRHGFWSRMSRWFIASGDAPSWSVTLSLLALFGVGGMSLTPALRNQGLLLGAGVALVVSAWVNVVIMNAVHYARMDAETGCFDFSGTDERSFEDYLYVSLGVQATFGVTDVGILTTRMRRMVSGHSAIAFAFNTVILAMLVSLLVSGL